ncbi:hypothetical protein [Polyangium fumosum]|uniref:Uncharacterized protein n=1 Tax=Polyangium fumosum TaxID=889272 RepID=A0A4U1J956_9BACT|nr:hypothetical protein [Polyangium fumosum]TKD03151.1 hypothetical protein E8A74_26905 [Polyangium fumosum]
MRMSIHLMVAVLFPTLAACSAPDTFVQSRCDPNAPIPDEYCRGLLADAGADGGGNDAAAPGPTPQSMGTCTEACVPVPSGGAGYWSEVPVSVRFDKPEALPKFCPSSVPNEKFRLFDELVAPPAACEACACEPSEGTCEGGPPQTIEIRAGTCFESAAVSLPFSGPAGWDGSCTSSNALPAGASCGGEFCAQSVLASALPGPTSESCAPKSAAPSFTTEREWKLGALACMANTNDDTCGESATKRYCVADPGPDYLYCVHGEGVLEPCPDNYNHERHEMYPEEPLDDRGCEACECGAPVGSVCVGSLHLYDDATCSSQFEQAGLASTDEKCIDILPDGRAIGAKAVTGVTYVHGTCGSSGGAPKGSASPNKISAITFCCRRSNWIVE